MTMIFIPTPITSEEQAEQLPDWTVAMPPDKGGEPMWKCECGYWETDGHDRRNAEMVGWTALVPIEVRIEGHTGYVGDQVEQRTYYIHTEVTR
ncbi:hypothetical protein [Brachybacterium phenoliresistens]|uniref:hypothetical protein n=1 Tax=Brachybacterium phenoliresistens TaxID=396014 RepID=UPI0031CF9131